MTAPAPTRRARIEVVNPGCQPTREWVRAVATMLLAHADREIQRERAAAAGRDQADEDGDQYEGNEG